MENQLRYDLTAEGFVAGIGYENYQHLHTGTEPFTLGSADITLWQLVNGTWQYRQLEHIAANWQHLYRDYKQARQHLKELIAARGGFEALAPEEKAIAASWFTVPEAAINSTLTLDELLAAGASFDANSKASREARYTAAFNYFRTVLSTADAVKVVNAIMYHNLETLYVKLGFEGVGTFNYKGAEDMVSIIDFIQSTPGTKFEAAGLASLGLMPNYGLTVQDLIDKALAIIKHGSY